MPELVGTLRRVGAVARDPEGRPLSLPYGPEAIGRIVFTADRRMMAALSDGRANLPVGTKRKCGGYCGDYTFDGTTLTTTVDAAPNPALVGTVQPRGRFEGERMILRPPPPLSALVLHRQVLRRAIALESDGR